MTATRELNVVTKQINLNDKEKMSVRLIPVTADEENINEIQTHIDKLEAKYEALVKDVDRYLELQQKFENANFSFVKEQDKQEYFRLNQELSKVGKEE